MECARVALEGLKLAYINTTSEGKNPIFGFGEIISRAFPPHEHFQQRPE